MLNHFIRVFIFSVTAFYFEENRRIADLVTPSCNADGTFAPRQYASRGKCYCVDPLGNRTEKKCPCV